MLVIIVQFVDKHTYQHDIKADYDLKIMHNSNYKDVVFVMLAENISNILFGFGTCMDIVDIQELKINS